MEKQSLATMKTLLVAVLLVGWIGLTIQADNSSIPQNDGSNNKTDAANGTSDSNITTTSPIITPTTASPVTRRTTSAPVDVSARPVEMQCLAKYKNCTEESGTASKGSLHSYCETLNSAMSCINDTSTPGSCNTRDTFVLDLLDCGPPRFFNSSVGESCKDRISECLSNTAAAKELKLNDDFKAFFCKAISDGACLTTNSTSGAVCPVNEKQAAIKFASCSAPPALLSSALVISLAILLQRLLKGY